MDLDALRRYCLSFPHATEDLKWGDNLLFRVGGKMFAIVSLDAVPPTLSLKCDEESFLALQEIEGVRPAPYLARAKWVQLDSLDTLPAADLQRRLRQAYEMILAKFPAKARTALARKPQRRRGRARA